MIRPSVNLEKYSYKISDVTFSIADKDEQIVIKSDLIRSLSIVNDYENAVTSSYMMSLVVQKSNYEKIIMNMSNINASFTITRTFIGFIYGDESDNNEYENNKTYQDSEFANLNLKVLNEQNINTINANKVNNDELSNQISNISPDSDYTSDLIQLTLYMYDASKLDKYKVNMSFITSGSMNDCIYQLFSQRNMNKLLVDPSNATSKNRSFAAPYGNLGFNLSKLNEYYGLYDYPYLFFMDVNRTYLINKGNLGRCLEKGEIGTVNIYLEKLEEQVSAIQTGCYCDEENKLYILNAREFEITDNDSSIDYVAGGNITTIIRGTGEIKHDMIGDKKIEKTYVVNNNSQHKQLIYNIKESKRSVGLTFSDVDLNIFSPNKSYVIIPDDTYYSTEYNISGKYRLKSSSILINKQAESSFKSSISTIFCKVE